MEITFSATIVAAAIIICAFSVGLYAVSLAFKNMDDIISRHGDKNIDAGEY